MRYDDPNRPSSANSHREVPRDLKVDRADDFMQDGYRLVARRPRVKGMTETVEPAKADRIERMFGPHETETDNGF